MLDQLVLAAQLALENVDANEMKSVMDRVYARKVSLDSDGLNAMESVNAVNAVNSLNAVKISNDSSSNA